MGDREEIFTVARDFGIPAVFGSGGLLYWLRSWWVKRQKRRRIDRLEALAIRKLLDVQRRECYTRCQPDALVDASEHEEQSWKDLLLISDIREELWLANGNQSKRKLPR